MYSQIHAKFVFCLVLRQALDLVQSQPKFANEEITKSLFVLLPGAVEINSAIHPFLDHCPSSTSCSLVTIDIKGTWTIRVDCINTTDGLAALVKLSTVLSWIREIIIYITQKKVSLRCTCIQPSTTRKKRRRKGKQVIKAKTSKGKNDQLNSWFKEAISVSQQINES